MKFTTNGTEWYREKMILCGIYFKTVSLSYATQSVLSTITIYTKLFRIWPDFAKEKF